MRTTCFMLLVLYCLSGITIAQEVAPSTRDPGAANKLLDLPEATPEEYALLEGAWELLQDTNETEEALRRVKTHQGGKTTVKTYDAEGNIVGQHSSEYKLKMSGMARLFVFFNVVPATGPSQGHTLPGPFYYACNVQGDTFLEVYGLLAGDDRSHRVLRWNRVTK
jgi:hypothetical protein